jgi:predicted RNase H-like HicB family nuclease
VTSFVGYAADAILKSMLQYHVAYRLPRGQNRMVVAEVLDFPRVVSQGFELADARLMIASALEDRVQLRLEEGQPFPVPDPDATAADADVIELLPRSVEAGAARPCSGTSCYPNGTMRIHGLVIFSTDHGTCRAGNFSRPNRGQFDL